MCRLAPVPAAHLRWTTGLIALGLVAFAQDSGTAPAGLRPAWRPIGNSAVELMLASPATGPVERVWYSDDGARLLAQTRSGRVFETKDFDVWRPSVAQPPDAFQPNPPRPDSLPAGESSVGVVRQAGSRYYVLGRNVYRSDDGGRHWNNLTLFRQDSIIGSGMRDLAVSPGNGDEIAVANENGVWRSVDGGLSWSGLNNGLPNLPLRRLLAAPSGSRGLAALLEGIGTVEWAPGEKLAWRKTVDPRATAEQIALQAARARLGAPVTAIAAAGEYVYTGARDGRIWISPDRGQNWRLSRPAGAGAVQSIYVDPREPRLALAALGITSGAGEKARVLRTINGGIFWDDMTSDLPDGDAHGIAADRSSGAIYVATERGVFLTFGDLFSASPATRWIPIAGLPEAPVFDVMLDPAGNQIYAAVHGYGVFAAPAPHRFRNPRAVNAADFSLRAAAPGSLLTVLGARVVRAQAGLVEAPVLHSSELESQIQVPFESSGPRTRLSLDDSRGGLILDLPVLPVSPAIFVDPDGTPLLLDGDTGTVLDAMNPARSNARVQILATGLGRVRPEWPTGMAAPLDTPPQVVAAVRAYVDRDPVEVASATLAPGFVGFYLVEIQLPAIVNAGPAELYVQAGGQESNRVRLYIEP